MQMPYLVNFLGKNLQVNTRHSIIQEFNNSDSESNGVHEYELSLTALDPSSLQFKALS